MQYGNNMSFKIQIFAFYNLSFMKAAYICAHEESSHDTCPLCSHQVSR